MRVAQSPQRQGAAILRRHDKSLKYLERNDDFNGDALMLPHHVDVAAGQAK
jgi:hypothetical protein